MIEEDIPDILEIEKECFAVPWSKEMFLQEINQQYAFVSAIDGYLVGFICGWKMADEFHITNIAVKPEFQNSGFGEKLLSFILKKIIENECEFVILEVREANIQARSFYKKHDFAEIGLRKNYYSNPKEDAIVMSLKLGI